MIYIWYLWPWVKAADIFCWWLNLVKLLKFWRNFESTFWHLFVTGTLFFSFTIIEGSSAGSWAYWLREVVYSSILLNNNWSTLAKDCRDIDTEEELVSNGIGEMPLWVLVGLVLNPSGCVVWGCAVDTERCSLHDVIEPLINAVMSSLLVDGPADVNVEWPRLRFQSICWWSPLGWLLLWLCSKYFSIASASHSVIRFAIGDKLIIQCSTWIISATFKFCTPYILSPLSCLCAHLSTTTSTGLEMQNIKSITIDIDHDSELFALHYINKEQYNGYEDGCTSPKHTEHD